MSDSHPPGQTPRTETPSSEPMREVLTKLLSNVESLSPAEKQLAATIRDLAAKANDTVRFNDTSVQHGIAVATGDFEKATGKALDLSPAQREEVAKYTAPSNPASPPKTTEVPKPATAEQTNPDPIRDVLAKLVANLNQLPESSKLGIKIRELDSEARDPVRFNQQSVQHEIAYATEDFEKAIGKKLDYTPAQRDEVTKLAATAPGVVNERVQGLLRDTPQIADSVLVGQIRRYALDLGRRRDQNTAEIQSQIDQLDSRVRVAARAPEPKTDARAGDASPKPEQVDAGPSGKAASNGTTNGQQRAQNGYDAGGSRNGQNSGQPPPAQTAVLRGGILDTLTSVLRGNGQPTNAPWDPQATPFGERVTAFQARVDARDQDRIIGRVENSARTALDALDGFRNTEGAAVMNRVQAAARAESGGMASVLSEMRDGGRFSDLRQAFNKALNDDKGFADAFDRAATALARYGEGREKVEQIIAKRPDAANLTAKFEQLDSQIGERASSIPSRNEGKNMLDDIAKNIAEIIQRATDAARAVFSRNPAAGPSASPAA